MKVMNESVQKMMREMKTDSGKHSTDNQDDDDDEEDDMGLEFILGVTGIRHLSPRERWLYSSYLIPKPDFKTLLKSLPLLYPRQLLQRVMRLALSRIRLDILDMFFDHWFRQTPTGKGWNLVLVTQRDDYGEEPGLESGSEADEPKPDATPWYQLTAPRS